MQGNSDFPQLMPDAFSESKSISCPHAGHLITTFFIFNKLFYAKIAKFSYLCFCIEECALYSLKSPISPNVYTRHSERPYSWAVRLCVYTGVWRYLTSTRGRQPTFRLIKHCKTFLSAVRGKIVKIRHYEYAWN